MLITKVDEMCKSTQENNCEINLEDKKKNVELLIKLEEERKKLEDKLLLKLEELKQVCITEGEITGILPIEIYKTLLPGEVEPKVKRRIGTTFKIPQIVLQQFNSYNANDYVGNLEANIELNKKIVAAAERLAKDKSANKSVRKKRRKDWQAASQRLLKLEKGLNKLKLSNKKLNNSHTNIENYLSSNFNEKDLSLNNLNIWPNCSKSTLKNKTKSCPTTPQGSIPNLLVTNIETAYKSISKIPNRINNPSTSNKQLSIVKPNQRFIKCHSTKSLINTYSKDLENMLNTNKVPTIPNKKLMGASKSCSRFQIININKNENQQFCETPLYANVGYTSSAPYKSAYRQSNFPTLQDSKHLSVVNKSLNNSKFDNSQFKPKYFSTEISDQQCFDNKNLLNYYTKIGFNNVSKISNSDKLGQLLKQISESAFQPSSYFLRNSSKQNQSLHCLQQQRCSSSSQSSAGSISIGSIASAASSGYHSSTLYIDPLCSTSTIANDETVFQKLKNLTSKTLSDSNFSTTSLDRKALKNGSTLQLLNSDNNITSNTYHRNVDNVNTTTFPVNNINWSVELSDFSKNRSNSAVQVVNSTDDISATSTLKKSSKSTSGLPLNNYSNNLTEKNINAINENNVKNSLLLKKDFCIQDMLALINSKSFKNSNLELLKSDNFVKNDGTVTIV